MRSPLMKGMKYSMLQMLPLSAYVEVDNRNHVNGSRCSVTAAVDTERNDARSENAVAKMRR